MVAGGWRRTLRDFSHSRKWMAVFRLCPKTHFKVFLFPGRLQSGLSLSWGLLAQSFHKVFTKFTVSWTCQWMVLCIGPVTV